MTKPKTKDWKIKAFSLDRDSITKLEEISNMEGLSNSKMIDFLITNWDIGLNPNDKLKDLQRKKAQISNNLKEIDNQINKTINQITLFNDWKDQKRIKKGEAVKILERKILNKEYTDAERIAKIWQGMCGVPSIELLIEAKQNIEKKGI
jgi:hypothetical protein